ncbi:MAG: hypothetical protein WCI41_01830 [bacterium]
MKKKLIVLGSTLALAPIWAFAASSGTSCYNQQVGIQAVICKIGEILNTLIPILIVLGVVYFVWGVIQYVIFASDEEAKKAGRNKMIMGIIGLVVIVGMWGLVKIVTSTFGLNNVAPIDSTPCVPGTPGC